MTFVPVLAGQPPLPRPDRLGDALPIGAGERFGTTRLRHHQTVMQLAFTPDGRSLLSHGTDHRLVRWELPSGRCEFAIEFPCVGLRQMALHPDGRSLYAADPDGIFSRIDLKTGETVPVATTEGHPRLLAISPDGTLLAAMLSNRRIRLLHLPDGRWLYTHPLTALPRDMTFVGKRTLVISHADHSIVTWKLAANTWHATLPGLPCGRHDLGSTRNGRLVQFADDSRITIGVVDKRPEHTIALETGHSGILAADATGQTIAWIDRDGHPRCWCKATGQATELATPATAKLHSLAVSADGDCIAAGSENGDILLWDRDGERLDSFDRPNQWVTGVACSPDGSRVATASDDGDVRLWDGDTGRCVHRITVDAPGNRAIAFALGGQAILCADRRGRIVVIDAKSGQVQNAFPVHAGAILQLDVAADGRSLVTAGPDRQVRTWRLDGDSAASARLVAVGPAVGHRSWLTDARIHPDGDWFASVSGDGVIHLRAFGAEGERMLPISIGEQCRLAFRPGHPWLASADSRRVRFHTLEGEPAMVDLVIPWDEAIADIAFSPNGAWFAIASMERDIRRTMRTPGYLRVYEVATGQLLRDFHGDQGRIFAITFTADGDGILSANEDRTALRWDLFAHATTPRPSLDQAIDAIRQADGERLLAARERLLDEPATSFSFLRERLQPVTALTEAEFEACVRELQSPLPRQREQAFHTLRLHARTYGAALRQRLRACDCPNVQQRLGQLLHDIAGGRHTVDEIEQFRWIQHLERRRDAVSRACLQRLTAGDPNHEVTIEAREACRRLARLPRP